MGDATLGVYRQLRRRVSRRQRHYATVMLVLVSFLVSACAADKQDATAPTSPEAAVRASIEQYGAAIEAGDLTTLRNLSCGVIHDNFAREDEASWEFQRAKTEAAKSYPVIDGIDDVQVSGDQATADVAIHLANDESQRSQMSFELSRIDGVWKVCDLSK